MNGPHFNRLILNFSTFVGILALLACTKQQAELVVDSGVVGYVDSSFEFPRLIFADGQTSQNDRCMVRMSKLNPKMPPIYVNGKAVGFCWTPCLRVFVQDPTPHVQKHSLAFQCVVSPDKSVIIDSSFMRQVNWETFYFSDSGAMNTFDSDILKYCGILTDPVSRQRFRPGHNSPHSLYGEKHFYFWSDSSKQKFDMMPAMFNVPNLTMEQLHPEGDSI